MKLWSDKEKTNLFSKKYNPRSNVYGRKSKTGKGPFPVCQNSWSSKCRIPQKIPNPCKGCTEKKYEHITHRTILKHIKGKESQIFYVLHKNGKVSFAAVDFDCKPGKENQGYTFENVKLLAKALKKWGIPYGIARSTGKGFHIYIFIKGEPYPAIKIRAIILTIIREFKIEERDGAPLPPLEVFPKQVALLEGQIGNGIKLPPIESSFKKERNCWVDDENNMVPASQQWNYFESIPETDGHSLDNVIKEKNINLNEPPSIQSKRMATAKPYPSAKNQNRFKKLIPIAKIQLVFDNCEALSKLAHKAKGTVLSYDEGFALFSLTNQFNGGRTWFKNNIKGWDESLEDSVELNGFSACFHACKNLQSKNICKFSREDTCLTKKYYNGVLTPPSPIRFANKETNLRHIFRGYHDTK